MAKSRRIKISKIENKILEVNCKLSRIESLSKILYECLVENFDVTSCDSQTLALVMSEEIRRTKNKMNKIETLLF